MERVKTISPAFESFLFDWDYRRYLAIGGYGSGKSYHVGFKIILKCLEEKRKVLVVREVYETIKESCFDLLKEILSELDLLYEEDMDGGFGSRKRRANKVVAKKSPMAFEFPNGSRIIFKGMDKVDKVKSINGVSIVWLEECSEIKYDAFKELQGRLRTPNISLHFILSCNPVGKESWVYSHFFRRINDEGKETVILDEEQLYEKKTIVKRGTYYLHTTVDDNPFVPREYVKQLDELKEYDPALYRVARLGRFGVNGTRVLPQFMVAKSPKIFKAAIREIPSALHFDGFDFGFEESYNAVVRMAVDDTNAILYLYDEIYVNKITDDKMANLPEMQRIKQQQQDAMEANEYVNPIIADCEDPKAIQYYRQEGYYIKGCRKFAGSRLSNTRKVKRFKKIICSPKCKNIIRELENLTYKKDAKGNVIYDDFNIDPHTFSAIWYGLNDYNMIDLKNTKTNSKSGQ